MEPAETARLLIVSSLFSDSTSEKPVRRSAAVNGEGVVLIHIAEGIGGSFCKFRRVINGEHTDGADDINGAFSWISNGVGEGNGAVEVVSGVEGETTVAIRDDFTGIRCGDGESRDGQVF